MKLNAFIFVISMINLATVHFYTRGKMRYVLICMWMFTVSLSAYSLLMGAK